MNRDLNNGIQGVINMIDTADAPYQERAEVARLLALSPAAYHIGLALIQHSSMHGYEIMQEINGWPHPWHRLDVGSLYRALPRMLSQGLIEETPGPASDGTHDERRRYYKITELGIEVVYADHLRRGRMIDLMRVALGMEKRWT